MLQLRKLHNLTQEDVAEKVGVSRQAVAKWESGETMPDLEKSRLLAETFGVSLDDLANFEPDKNLNVSVPPKGKHLLGEVTIGEKGQIVRTAKARKIFNLKAGDQLVVLGDETQGLALMKTEGFLSIAEIIRNPGR